MPLQLNFRIEDRGGVMVVIANGRDGIDVVRPASSAEVELWNALTRRFAAPVRESYIRVNEQDLVNVLMERDHLRKQVTELTKKIQELGQEHPLVSTDIDGQRREPHEVADAGGSPGGEPSS